jgi:hypothetical protein
MHTVPKLPCRLRSSLKYRTEIDISMSKSPAMHNRQMKTIPARFAMKSQLLSLLLVYYLAYKLFYTLYTTLQAQIIIILYDINIFFFLQKPCNAQQTNENKTLSRVATKL